MKFYKYIFGRTNQYTDLRNALAAALYMGYPHSTLTKKSWRPTPLCNFPKI